jgi:hypothetical protein
MQPTGWSSAKLGNEGLCGRPPDRPHLMRQSLGGYPPSDHKAGLRFTCLTYW